MVVADEVRVGRHPDQLAEQNDRRFSSNACNTMIYLGSALIILGAAAIIFCMYKSQGAEVICFMMAFIGIFILVILYLEDHRYVSQLHQTICLRATICYLLAIVLFLICVPGNTLFVINSFLICAIAVVIPLMLYTFGVFATGPDTLFQRFTQRLPNHPYREQRGATDVVYTISGR